MLKELKVDQATCIPAAASARPSRVLSAHTPHIDPVKGRHIEDLLPSASNLAIPGAKRRDNISLRPILLSTTIYSSGSVTYHSANIFSVSLYPTYDSFLENVRQEVRQNVRRLNQHPSGTLWAGNNEGEGYIESVRTALDNSSVYEAQYERLFDQVILQEVRQNTRSLSYIPSSTKTFVSATSPAVRAALAATALHRAATRFSHTSPTADRPWWSPWSPWRTR